SVTRREKRTWKKSSFGPRERSTGSTMVSALVYLQVRTMVNRLVFRVRRLRQPKYLFGGLVGALYFYFYFFRYLWLIPGVKGPGPGPGSDAGAGAQRALFELIGAAIF